MTGDDVGFQVGEDIGYKGKGRDEREEYLRAEDAQMYGVTYGGAGGGVPGWPGGGMGAGPAPVSGSAPYGREEGRPVTLEEAERREREAPAESEEACRRLERIEVRPSTDTSSASPRRGMGAESDDVHAAETPSDDRTDRSR